MSSADVTSPTPGPVTRRRFRLRRLILLIALIALVLGSRYRAWDLDRRASTGAELPAGTETPDLPTMSVTAGATVRQPEALTKLPRGWSDDSSTRAEDFAVNPVDGRLWAATEHGLRRWSEDGQSELVYLNAAEQLAFEPSGALWYSGRSSYACPPQPMLYRVDPDGRQQAFSVADGLSGQIQDILTVEDKVWVALADEALASPDLRDAVSCRVPPSPGGLWRWSAVAGPARVAAVDQAAVGIERLIADHDSVWMFPFEASEGPYPGGDKRLLEWTAGGELLSHEAPPEGADSCQRILAAGSDALFWAWEPCPEGADADRTILWAPPGSVAPSAIVLPEPPADALARRSPGQPPVGRLLLDGLGQLWMWRGGQVIRRDVDGVLHQVPQDRLAADGLADLGRLNWISLPVRDGGMWLVASYGRSPHRLNADGETTYRAMSRGPTSITQILRSAGHWMVVGMDGTWQRGEVAGSADAEWVRLPAVDGFESSPWSTPVLALGQGRWLALTPSGIRAFNETTGSTVWQPFAADKVDDQPIALLERGGDRAWAVSRHRIDVVDAEGTLTPATLPQPWQEGDMILAATADHQDGLWLLKGPSDPKSESQQLYHGSTKGDWIQVKLPEGEFGVLDGFRIRMIVDKEGGMWVNRRAGGLHHRAADGSWSLSAWERDGKASAVIMALAMEPDGTILAFAKGLWRAKKPGGDWREVGVPALDLQDVGRGEPGDNQVLTHEKGGVWVGHFGHYARISASGLVGDVSDWQLALEKMGALPDPFIDSRSTCAPDAAGAFGCMTSWGQWWFVSPTGQLRQTGMYVSAPDPSRVRKLVAGPNDEIWATYFGGISRRSQEGAWTSFGTGGSNPAAASLPSADLRDVVVDAAGEAWVSTGPVALSDDGVLTDGGLAHYDRQGSFQREQVTSLPKGAGLGALALGSTVGELWAAELPGRPVAAAQELVLHHREPDGHWSRWVYHWNLSGLKGLQLAGGFLWMATSMGLYHVAPETLPAAAGAYLPVADGSGEPLGEVQVMRLAPDGQLWVATGDTLGRWNPTDDRWRTWDLAAMGMSDLRDVAFAADGAVWQCFGDGRIVVMSAADARH